MSRTSIILKILFIISLVLVIYKLINPDAVKKIVLLKDKSFNVDIADSDEERQKGLSGRKSLAINEGLLFIFPNKDIYSFWMKDMLISLDIIWIDESTIVYFVQNASVPNYKADTNNIPTYVPEAKANKVLEVAAGTISDLNIQIGDNVEIVNE